MDKRLFETKDLCRYYVRGTHTVKAVDEVSLTINKGDYTAIVGSSGSGKSTILNLLAGLDTPTSGDIYAEGKLLSGFSRKEFAQYRALRIGMIFQSFNLIPHYTALRNVEMALYFDKTPKSERADKAQAMLESVGLADRMDHRPADLSGGEQQRVAVARALVKEPDVLFADEPTGNLDLENSQQIASLLKELHDKGITVIMVTHDMSLAENSAGRIIRMHYGKVVEGELS